MIFSCDPGLRGAFATYEPSDHALTVVDMPTVTAEPKPGRKTARNYPDDGEIWDLIQMARLMGCTHFILERVGGMPQQGAPAAFTFGDGVGFIRGAARAASFVVERPEPNSWKSALRVPADKQRARLRASELLPMHAHLWPLKGHDGRAEAALLAVYGALRFAPHYKIPGASK